MNEDFVPKEIALKLKEKGFDWRVGYAYDNVCNCMYTVTEYCINYIPAPTISQVLKWLRKEKKIHITIDIWGRTWGYDILALPSGSSLHWTAYDEKINSYEQAALAGIEYYLDNFI